MNKTAKVVATLATMTTATLVAAPIGNNITHKNIRVLAKPTTTTVKNVNSNNESKLDFTNVWNQNLFNFDIKNNTIEVNKGWAEVNPYSPNSLNIYLMNKYRDVIKSVSIKGGATPAEDVYNEFNNAKINNGDMITISSVTGAHYIMDGKTVTGSVTYEMTSNGLAQVTERASNMLALYDNGNVTVSFDVKPNTPVQLYCNGQEYSAISNSRGEVNTTIKGEIGENVTIIPQGELQTITTIKANPADYKLQKEKINVNNVWNQPLFTLGFNDNNTLKINPSWAETNPYYTGNNSMTVQLLNNEGTVIKTETYSGGKYIGDSVAKSFGNLGFKYGDILHITSNSGAEIVAGKGTYKTDVYFGLTRNGLEEINANNKSYKAVYTGTNIEVTGKTAANSKITITENGKKFEVTANNEGAFKAELPVMKVGSVVYILNSNGVTQPVTVTYNKNDFKLNQSKIEVINNWGSDAVNIGFNPETMKLTSGGYNSYLGSSTTGNAVGLYLYSNGKLVKGSLFNGDQNTDTFSNEFNNSSFNFGDIIGVCYNPNMSNIKVINGENNLDNSNGAMSYYEVTEQGLVPYTPKLSVNPLNILTNKETTSFNVTGKTAPNEAVRVEYNDKVYSGKANGEGDFTVKISSSSALNSTTPIVVTVNGEIPKTIFASPSNMLQSNSGVYIAGQNSYFGKITFNPITMKIQWLDADSAVNPVANNPTTYKKTVTPANLNTVINSSADYKVFGFTMKNSEGKTIISGSVNGTNKLQAIYDLLNNKSFEFGDVVTLYKNTGSLGFNVMSNGKVVTPNDSTVSFVITPNGLVDANKNQSVYGEPFNLNNYYAGNGIVATGQVASGIDASGKSLAQNMVMNQAMKNRVNAAIKGCTNDEEKAKAIFNIVSPVPYRNVGGNTINTYNNGGVCFNKAQLYAVMCQYAGLVSRVVTGYANDPSNYQRYRGFHSWNQVWIPSENQWMTVDTTWHIFNCGKYVNSTRHSFSVQATLWNPKESYTSYFKNDPAMAWENAGDVWNKQLYYNFNYGNDPEFRALFNGISPSKIISTGKGSSATITLNGINNTFSVSGNANGTIGGNTADTYMTVTLVSPTTGKVIFSDSIKANDKISAVVKILEDQHYNVGDLLEITNNSNLGTITVDNNNKNITTDTGIYQITDEGIVPYEFKGNAEAKAVVKTGIENEAIDSATVTGKVNPNQEVNIEINGQIFTTKSNGEGDFSAKINSDAGINAKTDIIINSFGNKTLVIKPTVVNKLELQDSSIAFTNVWNYDMGTFNFNSNNEINVTKGWCVTNPYLSNKDEAFAVSILNNKGKTIKTMKAMGDSKVYDSLYETFNGTKLQIGDSIAIDYVTSSNLTIHNVLVNGKLVKDYKITKPTTVTITAGGLVLNDKVK